MQESEQQHIQCIQNNSTFNAYKDIRVHVAIADGSLRIAVLCKLLAPLNSPAATRESFHGICVTTQENDFEELGGSRGSPSNLWKC